MSFIFSSILISILQSSDVDTYIKKICLFADMKAEVGTPHIEADYGLLRLLSNQQRNQLKNVKHFISLLQEVSLILDTKSYKLLFFFNINLISDESLKFPTSYPTSCLLGCVSLVDCLPQEEYRIKYPDGESESPFVFVCEDFLELDIRFPISGSHKICKSIICFG